MATYYELLEVAPDASDDAIETAYEAQYNRWRRLVTHHDPTVVNQANQTLQTLETVREILSDPSKRSAYDAGIGLASQTGGLADPSAFMQPLQQPAPAPMAPPAPPAPRASATAPAPSMPTNLWSCYKCHTDNPAQTKFCFKCGAQLVRQCPECHNETSLIATGMCGSCGQNYDIATQRVAIRTQLAALDREIGTEQVKLQTASNASHGGAAVGCGAIMLIVGFLVLLVASQSGGGVALSLVIMIIGGAALYGGLAGRGKHRSTASMTHQTVQTLVQKRHLLLADLGVVDPNALSATSPTGSPANSGAHAIFNPSRDAWSCSACGGFVRSDARLCKHCKVQFI